MKCVLVSRMIYLHKHWVFFMNSDFFPRYPLRIIVFLAHCKISMYNDFHPYLSFSFTHVLLSIAKSNKVNAVIKQLNRPCPHAKLSRTYYTTKSNKVNTTMKQAMLTRESISHVHARVVCTCIIATRKTWQALWFYAYTVNTRNSSWIQIII